MSWGDPGLLRGGAELKQHCLMQGLGELLICSAALPGEDTGTQLWGGSGEGVSTLVAAISH